MSKIQELFESDIRVINVGLELFHQSILDQGKKSIQVDWKPPANGNPRLIEILEKMNA